MSSSKRHHFIPEFILRNYTNRQGKFYIYLPRQDRFKSNEKLFSPKQQFYENYANRTFIGGKESLYIENVFSKLDSKVGSILHKCKTKGEDKLTGNEWLTLQHFVDMMYWRNPANEGLIKEMVKNAKDLSELGLSNPDGKMDLQQVNSNEGIYKYIRLLLPMTKEISYKKAAKIFLIRYPYKTIHGGNIPKLIGDNPVIYRRLKINDLHNEHFIFPFTPTFLLLRSNIKDVAIWKELRPLIDLMQIMQAKEYVAVTDIKYPGLLREFLEKYFTSVEQLRQAIFDHIFEKSEINLTEEILYTE